MVIHLVAVGRVRDASLAAACDGYATRAGRYVKLAIHEVREAGRRADTPELTRRLEGERLRAAVPDGARLVALTREGSALSSRAFAKRVARWRESARDVAVLLGGADGLDPALLEASERVSLSPLTLPHELARLVFLEQLYRAGTILRGEPYHKGA